MQIITRVPLPSPPIPLVAPSPPIPLVEPSPPILSPLIPSTISIIAGVCLCLFVLDFTQAYFRLVYKEKKNSRTFSEKIKCPILNESTESADSLKRPILDRILEKSVVFANTNRHLGIPFMFPGNVRLFMPSHAVM